MAISRDVIGRSMVDIFPVDGSILVPRLDGAMRNKV